MSLINPVLTSTAQTSTASTTQPTQGVQIVGVAAIRDRVLQTIRNAMPIATLFNLKIKINLDLFVKDQIFICKIAEFIAAFPKAGVKAGVIDAKAMKKYFENSEIIAEIKALFKEPAPYLAFFYEACADVLNQKPESLQVTAALEGRIFTLKNALIAQQEPKLIHKSQQENGIAAQDHAQIKDEGAHFIRHSLSLHLKKLESSSFQDTLLRIAEQLTFFIQNITSLYLTEKKYPCPQADPLTYRNPSGYNNHGLVAALIMETCLNALGYKTRLMGRMDLEPRVTLATRHSVVEVTGPDQSRYLVDPTHVQFHKDVCLEDRKLPTSPILVLKESEVDDYIEKNIMVHYDAHFDSARSGDKEMIKKLSEKDQLIAYTIDQLNIHEIHLPANFYLWVKNAFQRVWGLSSYTPCSCVEAFQEIFNGVGETHTTFNEVKHLSVALMTHHRSYSEIEKRLVETTQKSEALSLLAQLPREKRMKHLSWLDTDPRLKNVCADVNAYFRALKKVVNPDGKDLSVIYGCSGSDCTSILFATDASDLMFVDTTPVLLDEFQTALSLLKRRSSSSEESIQKTLEESRFSTVRNTYLGTSSAYINGKHKMPDVALKLLFELREIEADLDQVKLSSIEGGVKIDFSWQYHEDARGDTRCRQRSVTFVTADITKPESYPLLLKKRLQAGIDIFYMKGAWRVPELYPQFLPAIVTAVRPGGWLMTTDKTSLMESVDPGLPFPIVKTEENRLLEELIQQLVGGVFNSISMLEIYPPAQRHQRSPGSDLTYWSILNLRQKT